MYKSSILSYLSIKYIPIVIGIISLSIAFWIMVVPTFEVTVNGVKRNGMFSDSYLPLVLALISIIFYFTIGHRIVRIRINNNEFEFKSKGEDIIKRWDQVEFIKRYWLVAPPLYSVKYENDKRTYLFNTSHTCIATPIYVFDISEMGNFIKKRKKDIPFLKELKK